MKLWLFLPTTPQFLRTAPFSKWPVSFIKSCSRKFSEQAFQNFKIWFWKHIFVNGIFEMNFLNEFAKPDFQNVCQNNFFEQYFLNNFSKMFIIPFVMIISEWIFKNKFSNIHEKNVSEITSQKFFSAKWLGVGSTIQPCGMFIEKDDQEISSCTPIFFVDPVFLLRWLKYPSLTNYFNSWYFTSFFVAPPSGNIFF